MNWNIRVLAAAAGLAFAVSCQQTPREEAKTAPPPDAKNVTTKYGVEVVAGPMDKVLLKDYQPKTSLVVPETKVPKAKYPAIDVHTHNVMNEIKGPEDVAAWLRVMDEVGIETSVVFADTVGPEFDRRVEWFKPHGKRFIVFCGIDTSNIEAPDYPQRAAAELERCYRKGARGVGEVTDKGWGMQNAYDEPPKMPRDKRMHPDDPRLDAVWKKCGELKIPVNIHVADHPSCWQPLGPNQERPPDFQTFNLVGKDVPSYEELIASRDRMLAKHPKTTFIACHLGNQGHDLAALGKALDRYPNLYVDISARDYEIGRQPRAAAKFLARYKDRALFGTDMGKSPAMFQMWWRLLESGDEFMTGRLWWRQYGLELPAPVLDALYRGTARRVLNWEM
jgi:predicted TIM-barrel fold metal-dependent hydrolase